MYIALEEVNFLWGREQMNEVIIMYNGESSLLEISKQVKRKPLETFILLLDLAEKGRIKKRAGRGFYATL